VGVAAAGNGASETKASTPPAAPVTCAQPNALIAVGEEAEARKAYLKLLEGSSPPPCAQEGLEKLNKSSASSQSCKLGETYKGLGREEQAIKTYEKALEINLESECAKTGLKNVGPGGVTGIAKEASSFTDSVVELAGAVAAGLGVLAIALFIFLSLARVPWLGGYIRKLPGIGRLIGPRLSIEPISDDAADGKAGAPLAAAIKEDMQVLREEALAPLSSDDYDLDWPAPQEAFAEFVSDEAGLKNALEKASDISEQAKTVAAILSIVYWTLPIKRLTLSGVAGPTHGGAGIAVGLEENGKLAASTTIASKVVNADPKVPDYVDLATAVAVWTQFGIGCILAGQPITPEGAQSFALLRQGIDAAKQPGSESVARNYLQEAIRLDSENWAAYVAMASMPAEDDEHHELVVQSLLLGLKEIARVDDD
jgi:tetratricopeptide (TPR) repeat protein